MLGLECVVEMEDRKFDRIVFHDAWAQCEIVDDSTPLYFDFVKMSRMRK